MRSKTGTRLTALAATTALLVTACSGGTDGGSSSAPPGETVELTFWTWAPGMEDIVGVWNDANPDIQVTVQTQDGGDPAVTKLLTAIQAGSGAPDVMQTEYQKIPTLVASDALADLAGQLPDDVVSHYPEGVWNSVTLGTDAVYGIPQDSGPMQFYYRADIFAEMGLAVPTTWQEDVDNPSTGNWGGSATSVTSQSQHVAEATQFILWMNSSQEGVNLLADSGLYPADIPGQVEALADPPEFFANQPDFYQLAGQTAETAGNFTFGPNVNVTYSAYNDAFARAAETKDAAAFVEAVHEMQRVTVDDLKNTGFSVAD